MADNEVTIWTYHLSNKWGLALSSRACPEFTTGRMYDTRYEAVGEAFEYILGRAGYSDPHMATENIESSTYNPDGKEMTIVMKDGSVYKANVTFLPEVDNAYLARVIKGDF